MPGSPSSSPKQAHMLAAAAIAVVAVAAIALLPSDRAAADTTVPYAQLEGATEVFTCNAGNAGYGRDPRNARTLNDLALIMDTRSNSGERISLRMAAIRIRGGRMIASGESAERPFRPGEEIPSFAPDRRTPGLWNVAAMASAVRMEPQARIAEGGLRYVREHVPVRRFMEAAQGGRADEVLRLLGASGLRDHDLIILSPVPSNWQRLTAFTVHPTVVVLH